MQKDRQFQKLHFPVKRYNIHLLIQLKRILNEFVHGSTVLHMVYFKQNQAWRKCESIVFWSVKTFLGNQKCKKQWIFSIKWAISSTTTLWILSMLHVAYCNIQKICSLYRENHLRYLRNLWKCMLTYAMDFLWNWQLTFCRIL